MNVVSVIDNTRKYPMYIIMHIPKGTGPESSALCKLYYPV